MKILISAYACEPGVGSEPEVGLKAAVGAARAGHDVWLITRDNNRQKVEKHLAESPVAERIHLYTFDLSASARRWKKKLGELGMHWYYDRWQSRAGELALELDRDVDFDVVHHVTFATYWTRAGASLVDAPFVWGPVGGGVEAPVRLLPQLGAVGALRDAVRYIIRRLAERRSHLRTTIRRADLALAQNPETAARLSSARSVDVAPNGTSAVPEAHPGGGERSRDVLFVGRLIPYKAGVLAVRAIARVETPGSRLVVIGDGPDRPRMERLAERLGVADRVEFLGRIPRAEVFERVATAGVFAHPALHDDSPLSVAEALALGTPVVCLDRGGPPVVCKAFSASPSTVVSDAGSADMVADRIACAIDAHLGEPPPVSDRVTGPDVTFEERMLEAYRSVLPTRR